MARKPDLSAYRDFDQITARLDEIVGQVRDGQTSLERSLDLFDEAIALGSKAVEMVDTTEFTPAERERLREDETTSEAGAADPAQPAGD